MFGYSPMTPAIQGLPQAGSPVKMYIRPSDNIRDFGASIQKTLKELQKELQEMELLLQATINEQAMARQRLETLSLAQAEVQGLATYTVTKLAQLERISASHDVDVGAVDMDMVRASLAALEKDVLALKEMERMPDVFIASNSFGF
ncbi:hypothetical protein HDU91_006904 [Kappamyces sp. JEL0680]|nr:hypothetical protein HDU91_006904 [Kappamyces sp. JEL0680]